MEYFLGKIRVFGKWSTFLSNLESGVFSWKIWEMDYFHGKLGIFEKRSTSLEVITRERGELFHYYFYNYDCKIFE